MRIAALLCPVACLLATINVPCAAAASVTSPNTNRSVCKIVNKWEGYTCSSVNVTTSDGYILTMFRIRSLQCDTSVNHPPAPVLLWHGLLDSAFTWVLNMPTQSLAYILADSGYDVWLGNSRGNLYARHHTWLDPTEEAFWQWTWDQMASQDLPASVLRIQNLTGSARVGYVAHSQGTIQMHAALSAGFLDPQSLAFSLGMGPIIVAAHAAPPIGLGTFQDVCRAARAVDKKAFDIPVVLEPAWDAYCESLPRLCAAGIELVVGPVHNLNTSASQIALLSTHEPGGTSSLNMVHWAQLTESGQFGYFDYGTDHNPSHYNGSSVAPLYNFSNYPSTAVPTALLSGSADVLADPTDVSVLLARLPPAVTNEVHVFEGFEHMDFVWNMDAADVVYRPFLIPFAQKHLIAAC